MIALTKFRQRDACGSSFKAGQRRGRLPAPGKQQGQCACIILLIDAPFQSGRWGKKEGRMCGPMESNFWLRADQKS